LGRENKKVLKIFLKLRKTKRGFPPENPKRGGTKEGGGGVIFLRYEKKKKKN